MNRDREELDRDLKEIALKYMELYRANSLKIEINIDANKIKIACTDYRK